MHTTDLLVLLPHLLCDPLSLSLLLPPLPLNVDLLVLGSQPIEFTLEVQVSLLLLLVLQKPLLSLVLLLQDRHSALLGSSLGLLLNNLPLHHHLESLLGTLFLLKGPGLRQALLSDLLRPHLLLELLAALSIQLLRGLQTHVDTGASVLLLLLEGQGSRLSLLLQHLLPPQILCTELVLLGLHLPCGLLLLLGLLNLRLPLPLRLSLLPLVDLLLFQRLHLASLLQFFLLPVELLLGDLFFQFQPGVKLHLLSLLLGVPLVVQLFQSPRRLSHPVFIQRGLLVQLQTARLQLLQLLQLATQGILQPIALVLLRLQELPPLLSKALAVQSHDGTFAEATLLRDQLQLLVAILLLALLLSDNRIPRTSRRCQQVPSLGLKEVIPQLY
mmetsp:Transcript_63122/g.137193  ORF Transcript_63122/g.137193 Transcript_63122/m.137193 type:complete len:385 (-) Transcript_63122:365-1519(-)